MVNFESILIQFENMGMMDVFLPWLLIFSLTFAILQRIKVFNKGAHVALAFVMGLVPVIMHVLGRFPPCWDVVVIINGAMAEMGMLLIALLMFFLILGLFGFQVSWFSRFLGWIAIAAFIFVGYRFLNNGGPGCDRFRIDFLGWLPYAEWIVAGLVCVFLIWLITREGRGGSGGIRDGDMY